MEASFCYGLLVAISEYAGFYIPWSTFSGHDKSNLICKLLQLEREPEKKIQHQTDRTSSIIMARTLGFGKNNRAGKDVRKYKGQHLKTLEELTKAQLQLFIDSSCPLTKQNACATASANKHTASIIQWSCIKLQERRVQERLCMVHSVCHKLCYSIFFSCDCGHTNGTYHGIYLSPLSLQ